MANDGEVVGGEAGANGGLVIVELDVEAPVKSVLHFPTAAHCTRDALCIGWQRTDVVATLASAFAGDGSLVDCVALIGKALGQRLFTAPERA